MAKEKTRITTQTVGPSAHAAPVFSNQFTIRGAGAGLFALTFFLDLPALPQAIEYVDGAAQFRTGGVERESSELQTVVVSAADLRNLANLILTQVPA